MRFTIIILPIIILFIRCKESDQSIKEFEFRNVNQKEEIYSLVNSFVLDSLFKNAVISIEAMGFCKTLKENSPPMPLGFYYCYDSILFDTLMNSHLIDSLDIKSFLHQIEQVNPLKWDSLKLNVKTVSRDTLYKMNSRNEDIYKYITDRFHARGLIILSTPLFSKNDEVVVMSIAYYCGSRCGGGIIYAFKKVKGKWQIMYSNQEWIS
jgi:hypothetical protein